MYQDANYLHSLFLGRQFSSLPFALIPQHTTCMPSDPEDLTVPLLQPPRDSFAL